MLRPRLIVGLLLQNSRLVKTIKFKEPRYIGDPINTVRLFNEKLVDELVILDIDATSSGAAPNQKLIAAIAKEGRMPLCYGGGVKTVAQIESIIQLGVEKVCLSSILVSDKNIADRAAARIGRQSIVAAVDIKSFEQNNGYEVVTHNATVRTGLDPLEFISELNNRGIGEVLINFVDRDGTMEGYNLEYISKIRAATNLPTCVLGGAGTLKHVEELWVQEPSVGAAAGSLFTFKGRLRAVLINYPTQEQKIAILKNSGWSHSNLKTSPKP